MISINKRLNLVIPIEREDGTTLYVHAMPIARETFETYYMVLAKTWNTFANNQLNHVSAPTIAYLTLRDVARQTQRLPGMSWDEGPDGISGEMGLVANMVRMANVITPQTTDNTGATPLQIALDKGIVTEEEKHEVLNILTFFTVVSHAAPKDMGRAFLMASSQILQMPTTYSTVMEYARFLRTSTDAATIGENAQA